jgi:hypothetical protein
MYNDSYLLDNVDKYNPLNYPLATDYEIMKYLGQLQGRGEQHEHRRHREH